MTYAMIYAENGDVVGMYASRDQAVQRLAAFVESHPDLQDEIGLRPYEEGRPAGEYEAATDVLGNRLTHQHLA